MKGRKHVYKYSEYIEAAEMIRNLCEKEDAAVHFVVGGTQANLTVIDAALRPYQGTLCAASGHINVHETGAVEATGHKVLGLPHMDGKITAAQVTEVMEKHLADASAEHTVQPKLVYISSPTEFGTLYSKAVSFFQTPDRMYLPELKEEQDIRQYVNGTEEREGIYWEEYLEKKDKYSVYLGGNRGVDVVKNYDVKNGRKLLILKDSYANSMIPYLATNFSEIHLIDLRYYNFNVYDYIEEQGITDAAAIYSVKQLCDVSIANKLIVR